MQALRRRWRGIISIISIISQNLNKKKMLVTEFLLYTLCTIHYHLLLLS